MKIRILILIFLSINSLPLRAEETNTWDNFLSFFSSGDNQGEDCEEESAAQQLAENIRSEVCPNFMIAQAIKRDQKTMLIDRNISADKLCRDFLKDPYFKDGQSFENYLKNKEPFSEINTTPIADCLSHPVGIKNNGITTRTETLSEDKHKVFISEYYLTQNRLESGLRNTLQDITAIDQLIGNPTLNKIDCNQFQYTPNIVNECASFQQCSTSKGNLKQIAK